MSTSNGPILITEPPPRRDPLQLRMAERPGRDHLDGGWRPQSRDLAVELADLVDHFPSRWGPIVGAVVSPPDWGPTPRLVRAAAGCVQVGPLLGDDVHRIDLITTDRTVLRVLVVPPHFTRDQGDEALLAAATAGNMHSAADLLDEVTDHPETRPKDHWTDDGEPWWGHHGVAPSFRTGS